MEKCIYLKYSTQRNNSEGLKQKVDSWIASSILFSWRIEQQAWHDYIDIDRWCFSWRSAATPGDNSMFRQETLWLLIIASTNWFIYFAMDSKKK